MIQIVVLRNFFEEICEIRVPTLVDVVLVQISVDFLVYKGIIYYVCR